MSAANTPAICHCGAVGPTRGPLAIAAGWTAKRHATKPTWFCPDHVPAAAIRPAFSPRFATLLISAIALGTIGPERDR